MMEHADSTSWQTHFCRLGSVVYNENAIPTESDIEKHHLKVEPWLSAIFQSEHLSLLIGSGLSIALAKAANAPHVDMSIQPSQLPFNERVLAKAAEEAKSMGRGTANIEDQIRISLALLAGLDIQGHSDVKKCATEVNRLLSEFLKRVLANERSVRLAFDSDANGSEFNGSLKVDGAEAVSHSASPFRLLSSFLMSFASRAATRERLHVFTTNYDRLIEFGSDAVGLRLIDRFVGLMRPVFRSPRLDIDVHYNPPGIRGEPRYLEGVVKFTKLHGSLDWRSEGNDVIRVPLPFGAPEDHPEVPSSPLHSTLIYPNPSKDVETSEYPYSELFRDFSAAICRPNSVLVTYGYGFGDDHINRVVRDMLSIPSTHLVIISYHDADERIAKFCRSMGRWAQSSLLIGSHFGDLEALVDNYLPKPAIDLISKRRNHLLRNRLDVGAIQAGDLNRQE